MRKPLVSISAALTVSVAVWGGSASATAEVSNDAPSRDALDCVFTGVASLSPAATEYKPLLGIEAYDYRGGHWLSAQATCTFADGDDPSPGSQEASSTTGVYDATLESSGAYVARIPGGSIAGGSGECALTMAWSGWGGSLDFGADNPLVEGPYWGIGYDIEFLGREGRLTVSAVQNSDRAVSGEYEGANGQPGRVVVGQQGCAAGSGGSFPVAGSFTLMVPQ